MRFILLPCSAVFLTACYLPNEDMSAYATPAESSSERRVPANNTNEAWQLALAEQELAEAKTELHRLQTTYSDRLYYEQFTESQIFKLRNRLAKLDAIEDDSEELLEMRRNIQAQIINLTQREPEL